MHCHLLLPISLDILLRVLVLKIINRALRNNNILTTVLIVIIRKQVVPIVLTMIANEHLLRRRQDIMTLAHLIQR